MSTGTWFAESGSLRPLDARDKGRIEDGKYYSAMSPTTAPRSLGTLGRNVVILLMAATAPALGHEKKAVGPVHLVIGWGTEPAVSGSRNSVEVEIQDRAGKPVVDGTAQLSVQVTFGDQTVQLPLLPSGDRPGHYSAWLVPTRAGTYTFHLAGKVKGQTIATTSTCSDKTFDCVVDGSDMQFPAKDPTNAELADRLSRSLPRAERATAAATRAWWMAVAAIVLSACAVAVVLVNARK